MRPPDVLSIGVVVRQASSLWEDGNIIDTVMNSRHLSNDRIAT